jgi:hypothetical protein
VRRGCGFRQRQDAAVASRTWTPTVLDDWQSRELASAGRYESEPPPLSPNSRGSVRVPIWGGHRKAQPTIKKLLPVAATGVIASFRAARMGVQDQALACVWDWTPIKLQGELMGVPKESGGERRYSGDVRRQGHSAATQ